MVARDRIELSTLRFSVGSNIFPWLPTSFLRGCFPQQIRELGQSGKARETRVCGSNYAGITPGRRNSMPSLKPCQSARCIRARRMALHCVYRDDSRPGTPYEEPVEGVSKTG